MKLTYLSVDLDYWGFSRNAKSLCTRFFNKVFSLNVPILIVRSHHNILDDVNTSGCKRIEHVDYHSDLADWNKPVRSLGRIPRTRMRLTCGTWLSYVKWRDKGEVIWRYPSPHCLHFNSGYCHDILSPFEYPVSGWNKTNLKQGLSHLPWDDIKKVGVAISEDFWFDDGNTYETVLPKLLGENKDLNIDWRTMVRKNKFRGLHRVI